MDVASLKAELEHLTEQMKGLVNTHLKNDGDTCELSQRTCVLNAIMDVEHNINGIGQADFIGHTEPGFIVTGPDVEDEYEADEYDGAVARVDDLCDEHEEDGWSCERSGASAGALYAARCSRGHEQIAFRVTRHRSSQ